MSFFHFSPWCEQFLFVSTSQTGNTIQFQCYALISKDGHRICSFCLINPFIQTWTVIDRKKFAKTTRQTDSLRKLFHDEWIKLFCTCNLTIIFLFNSMLKSYDRTWIFANVLLSTMKQSVFIKSDWVFLIMIPLGGQI